MGKTALPGKRLTVFAMDPWALTIIGLDTQDGREHTLYDKRVKKPVSDHFVRNIEAYGILHPVIVRKNGPLTEVVVGRQRVRAARLINKKGGTMLVPCTVKRSEDADSVGIMISENENRLDDDPVTRAQKAAQLLSYGKTEDDVAVAFGISKQAVRNLLLLLDLSTEVQKAVAEERLSFSAAIELRDLTREEQSTKLAELLAAGATGVAEVKRQRRERAKKNGAKSADPRGRAVKINTLRKLADNEEFTGTLSRDAKAILLWICGDENAAKRVKGLTAILGG